jgi:hypothetical protein
VEQFEPSLDRPHYSFLILHSQCSFLLGYAVTEAYLNCTAQAGDEWLTVENFFRTTQMIWIERVNICVTKRMRYFRVNELFLDDDLV